MSDAQLRELERQALATGDIKDVLAYMRAYARTLAGAPEPKAPEDAPPTQPFLATSLGLQSNPMAPIAPYGTVSLRNNNGVLEISENCGAWVRVAKERSSVEVPPVRIELMDANQIKNLVTVVRALTDAVVEAGIARRPTSP